MTTVAIRALVIIIIVTIAGIIAVNVLIPGENTALTVQIVSVVAPTTAALLGLINSVKNTEVIQATKAQVIEAKVEVAQAKEQLAVNSEKIGALDTRINGRLSELMEKSVEAARLLGHQQGEKDERDRQGG